ncbi:MAG: hypothetical protein A2623_08745 [Caulobacterales bacterium RIFCSPHIGHO2_01_FULL_70_19]|nr:MAG: hypothetical protein A2623_08745 [Caulobacterales bacterium RIFCSPHIGHO2_01_FULL_70_19]
MRPDLVSAQRLTMTTDRFSAFVAAELESARNDPFDADARIREWLDDVEALYRQVESFLAAFTASGAIRLERRPTTLNEEFLGTYEISRLVIEIGPKQVELRPIGALIFGAHGRVDLIGPRDSRKLVLVDKAASRARIRVLGEEDVEREKRNPPPPPTWAWKFSEGPRRDYVELDERAFKEAVLAVAS